jgi:hypothetical protein
MAVCDDARLKVTGGAGTWASTAGTPTANVPAARLPAASSFLSVDKEGLLDWDPCRRRRQVLLRGPDHGRVTGPITHAPRSVGGAGMLGG